MPMLEYVVQVSVSFTSSQHPHGFQKDFGKVQNLLRIAWGEGSSSRVCAGEYGDATAQGRWQKITSTSRLHV